MTESRRVDGDHLQWVMHTILPSPTSLVLSSGFYVAAPPLTMTGPEWIATTARTIDGSPLFPGVQYAAKGPAALRVVAPDDAELPPTELPDSSYRLDVTEGGITLECRGPSGLIAALSALQGLRSDAGYQCATIDDTPRFRYRGIHLDVARHFFDAEFVKRTIHLVSALGFNVFHWHLTEDQAWRLPVPDYPRLTEVGAYRTESDGSRYGGFYTEDQVSDVVRYAGAHGVLVIPEIELPGHSRAALASYPELSCEQKPLEVANSWGIFDDVLCAGNQDVFTFLEAVFDQVIGLFPSRYIHLGGDESPRTRWKACPRCQARIREEHLADEDELQSYFVGRAARLLAARGRTAIGWDEILEGGLPAGTMVMSWRGTSGGIRAAEMGHDVIMAPTSHCYFDYSQSVLPVETVHRFDPAAGLSDDAARHVLGGQACVWTEHLPAPADVEYMIAPRILAMAEALWTDPARRDFAEFKPRANAWLSVLQTMGWNYARTPELET